MALDENGVTALATGGASSLFDKNLSSKDKALSFLTGGGSGLLKQKGVAGLMTGGAASLFDKNLTSSGKALSLVTGGTSQMLGCGGKDKPKPWANTPGGRNGYRGKKLLEAYNYLLPATLDITRRGAEGYGQIYRDEADKTRRDELEGFEKYGGRYVDAINRADPLRGLIRERVTANLEEGLDPSMRREVQQGARGAYSARGLANSGASAVEELLASGRAGKALESQNISEAMRLINTTDPFLAYAGRPSAPQGSNPTSPQYQDFNNDLFSTQINDEIMKANADQASKNRTAGYINAGIGLAGSAAGAFI